MSDSQRQPGGNRIPDSTRVVTDQRTITGDGSSGKPLAVVPTSLQGLAFALANIENNEGAALVAGMNVSSIEVEEDGTLQVKLTTPVTDVTRVSIQVTLKGTLGVPTTIYAEMIDASTIGIQMEHADSSPVVASCFVVLYAF